MNIVIPSPENPVLIDTKSNLNIKELKIRNTLTLIGFDYDFCSKLGPFQNNETIKYEEAVALIIEKFFSQKGLINSQQMKYQINMQQNSENQGESPQKDNGNIKQCPICYELLPLEEFYEIPSSKHVFCKKCIIFYITQSILSGSNVLKIKCPDDCGYVLKDQDLKQIFCEECKDEEWYIKYVEMKNKATFNNDPKYHCCIRRDCENFILKEIEGKKLTCKKCGLMFCFDCELIWHENQSCHEALCQYYQICIDLGRMDKENQEREKSKKNRLLFLRKVNFILVLPLIIFVVVPILGIVLSFLYPFWFFKFKCIKKWNCKTLFATIFVMPLIIILMPISLILLIIWECYLAYFNMNEVYYKIYGFYEEYLQCC